MDLEHALQVVSARQVGDDRAAAFAVPGGQVFVLADGAGGTSGGGLSADTVTTRVGMSAPSNASDCVAILQTLDRELTDLGQTTALIVIVSGGVVFGASVGDSTACLVDGAGAIDLTEHQRTKPLLGSGRAAATPFGPFAFRGRLLLGSDGLFKYVPHERIRSIATSLLVTEVADALIAAARLPSGNLQDDISVIVVGRRC